MRIQKFQAPDMREAIAEVKRALGSEAVIVATREIRRGILGSAIEVTAAIENDEPAFATASVPSPAAVAAAHAYAEAPSPGPASTGLSEADLERILLPIRSEMRTLRTMLKPVMTPQTDGLRAELEALRREIAIRTVA